ncbi:hypothetical protein [Glycomyces buryatensis]|uniref:Uncharacterized protein n=1 Tax=Glycomyces buryatensis TaxID=2570927 RepID=A0A4S8Q889_9ACTN|nr:hypothetical protein [Glycomyces buryatensis]THV40488.1 hypothetical protein FAB82_14545 [Glycomyces buryatensis]
MSDDADEAVTDDQAGRDVGKGGLRRAFSLLVYRIQTVSILGYMGAASIIGIEALALVIGFTTALPIAIPFVVVILGTVYFLRERLKAIWSAVLARLGGSKPADERER